MDRYGDGKRSIEILFDGREGRISLYVESLFFESSFADNSLSKRDNDIISHIFEYCMKCQ